MTCECDISRRLASVHRFASCLSFSGLPTTAASVAFSACNGSFPLSTCNAYPSSRRSGRSGGSGDSGEPSIFAPGGTRAQDCVRDGHTLRGVWKQKRSTGWTGDRLDRPAYGADEGRIKREQEKKTGRQDDTPQQTKKTGDRKGRTGLTRTHKERLENQSRPTGNRPAVQGSLGATPSFLRLSTSNPPFDLILFRRPSSSSRGSTPPPFRRKQTRYSVRSAPYVVFNNRARKASGSLPGPARRLHAAQDCNCLHLVCLLPSPSTL